MLQAGHRRGGGGIGCDRLVTVSRNVRGLVPQGQHTAQAHGSNKQAVWPSQQGARLAGWPSHAATRRRAPYMEPAGLFGILVS
jgi:hypothetical protein